MSCSYGVYGVPAAQAYDKRQQQQQRVRHEHHGGVGVGGRARADSAGFGMALHLNAVSSDQGEVSSQSDEDEVPTEPENVTGAGSKGCIQSDQEVAMEVEEKQQTGGAEAGDVGVHGNGRNDGGDTDDASAADVTHGDVAAPGRGVLWDEPWQGQVHNAVALSFYLAAHMAAPAVSLWLAVPI